MSKKVFRNLDGFILLDKPSGLSSNNALQKVRHVLEASKAGHAGTLDPFATGLLVCCFGKYTKFSAKLIDSSKSYIATLKFGEETDSGDFTGNILNSFEGNILINEDFIINILNSFIGEITQIPPMYSAIKYKGIPLYKYARKGIDINRESRKINIYNIKLLSLRNNYIVIEVFCSKGTYIRTLAQDIGRKSGFFAHLVALRRLSVGPFFINQAINLDSLLLMEEPTNAMLDENKISTIFFKS
ncbi:MAG: tRNA pseudouridine(55) synthase TruB [Candidatus Kinetoplastibacterium crithidii]|nr:tRNA pseudouridine(55) synthase TruB [Candidatus Kinetoplastibacterium crithidii]